ncbi:MAG: RIP metalloprotease RseP [Proteobacteria bacterium]|nr:RIP metalloprotease RseP [Pseudomonadota bacterium]
MRPEIYGWTDKHGTRWKIAAFPLGGYVKMYGDAGAASTPDKTKIEKMTKKQKAGAFHYKPLHAKAAVVAAGPAANFLFAIVILTGFFMTYGHPESAPVIGEVLKESAAEKAGFKKGDTVLELGGDTIKRFEDIRRIAQLNPDIPLPFKLSRQDKIIEGTVTPKLSETKDLFGNEVKVGLIGVGSGPQVFKKLNPAESFIASFTETYNICASTLKAVGQMLTGRRSSSDLSGILRIAQYSGQSTSQGLSTVFWFMALLSINLGLINLFPVPMLDGGHLMYYAVEAASGKPLAEKVQDYGFRIGFVLLVALMLLATFNDLKHFKVL